jgi:hypothetical protein
MGQAHLSDVAWNAPQTIKKDRKVLNPYVLSHPLEGGYPTTSPGTGGESGRMRMWPTCASTALGTRRRVARDERGRSLHRGTDWPVEVGTDASSLCPPGPRACAKAARALGKHECSPQTAPPPAPRPLWPWSVEWLKSPKQMAGSTGLEPATSGLAGHKRLGNPMVRSDTECENSRCCCDPILLRDPKSDPVSWDTELARMTVTKEAGHGDEAE